MWYDGIDRNTFIKQIYTKVPELLNVRIDAISFEKRWYRSICGFLICQFIQTILLKNGMVTILFLLKISFFRYFRVQTGDEG